MEASDERDDELAMLRFDWECWWRVVDDREGACVEEKNEVVLGLLGYDPAVIERAE